MSATTRATVPASARVICEPKVQRELSAPAPELAALLERVLSGEQVAWQQFQLTAEPLLERWARSHRGLKRRQLTRSHDDVREIVVATLERVRAREFAGLRKLRAIKPLACDPDVQSWLYGAFDFAVREHLRLRFGRPLRGAEIGRSGSGELGPTRRDLHTLAARFEHEPPARTDVGMTAKLTARAIMEYAERTFSPREACALRAYLQDDASYEQLAQQLSLVSGQEAEQLIRKLKERLRARFQSSP